MMDYETQGEFFDDETTSHLALFFECHPIIYDDVVKLTTKLKQNSLKGENPLVWNGCIKQSWSKMEKLTNIKLDWETSLNLDLIPRSIFSYGEAWYSIIGIVN